MLVLRWWQDQLLVNKRGQDYCNDMHSCCSEATRHGGSEFPGGFIVSCGVLHQYSLSTASMTTCWWKRLLRYWKLKLLFLWCCRYMLWIRVCCQLLSWELELFDIQKPQDGVSRLKRMILIGDHHQLPPVIKNMAFQKFCNMEQSLFTRFVRLGVPTVELDAQGRSRARYTSCSVWLYVTSMSSRVLLPCLVSVGCIAGDIRTWATCPMCIAGQSIRWPIPDSSMISNSSMLMSSMGKENPSRLHTSTRTWRRLSTWLVSTCTWGCRDTQLIKSQCLQLTMVRSI